MAIRPGLQRVFPLSAANLLRDLLRWYRCEQRDLPWRRTRDPYAVLVSEVMLQQTTVKAVLPYYRSFLERFPDWRRLAEAGEDELLSAWSGLGYYARVRNLQAAARFVIESEEGQFPNDLSRARRLPGVGDYTAGAVLSIAYGLPEPALDGNARRVLARLFGVRGDPRRGQVSRRLRSLALLLIGDGERAIRRGSMAPPGEVNQALMELGALVCVTASPACERCPVRAHCRALSLGIVPEVPLPSPRPPAIEVFSSAAVIRHGACTLLLRRGPSELMGRFWELPGTFPADLEAAGCRRRMRSPAVTPRPGHVGSRSAIRLASHLRRRHGLAVMVGQSLASVQHAVTFRRIRLTVYEAFLARTDRPRSELLWAARHELPALPIAALTRKALCALP